MPLDFRNTNTLWCSVAIATLARLGLTTAIVCPGSRSTPLTVALATHPQIEAIPILDERSAAFFALGCAKQQHRPVVLVCTSGTAGANFYPAIIEARETNLPLLIFTTDRPPEMRACTSGQTIDQQKLFGDYPLWYSELATPFATLSMLAYVRQTMVQAWRIAQNSITQQAGPVHLNWPFRDPLAPQLDPEIQSLALSLDEAHFFSAITPIQPPPTSLAYEPIIPWQKWIRHQRGLIVAGPIEPAHPQSYCQAIHQLSTALGWPVLAEGLSPLRNYQAINPTLISTYDTILRHPDWANQLKPDCVIQLGPLPISKVLRQWLQTLQPIRWILSPKPQNLDPLHGPSQQIQTSLESLTYPDDVLKTRSDTSTYQQQWQVFNHICRQHIDTTLAPLKQPFEGKIAWLLSQTLPPKTPIFIANSMPARDVEYFWQPNNLSIQPYFNRGANGIDGTLSTALGIAHHNRSTILLTGDLAFLHDTNGLLQVSQLSGHLTIIVINNQGGGIFEMLPIAQFDPPFEQYFATPQTVNLQSLCQAYDVDYILVKDWQQLTHCLTDLPSQGVRLLEIKTNRKTDAQWRNQFFSQPPH